MSDEEYRVIRTYTVMFSGQPSIQQVQDELVNAAKAMQGYTRIAITSNGSTDPSLEEITFTMENRR